MNGRLQNSISKDFEDRLVMLMPNSQSEIRETTETDIMEIGCFRESYQFAIAINCMKIRKMDHPAAFFPHPIRATDCCLDSVWILSGFCLDSVWILSGFCLDSVWILSGFRDFSRPI
jgi:hypothetical protein